MSGNIQRDANALGGDSARARLLQERVRAGELSQDHVLLAAHLGDRIAKQALNDETTDEVADLRDWVEQLGLVWGKSACLRAAVAAARESLIDPPEPIPGFPTVHALLQAVQAWVVRPSQEHAVEVRRLAREAHERSAPPTSPFVAVAAAAACLAAEDAKSATQWTLRAVDFAARARGQNRVRAAISIELVPWALGLSDPLKPNSG